MQDPETGAQINQELDIFFPRQDLRNFLFSSQQPTDHSESRDRPEAGQCMACDWTTQAS